MLLSVDVEYLSNSILAAADFCLLVVTFLHKETSSIIVGTQKYIPNSSQVVIVANYMY